MLPINPTERKPQVGSRRSQIAAICVALALALCVRFAAVSMELVPASFPECKGPNIAVQVKWNATLASFRHGIDIYVYQLGKLPTLWYGGPNRGEHTTGKWVSDGATFLLVDHKGKVLARRTLQSTPCKVGSP